MDTRRSAAVQFFMETDSSENISDYQLVVQWLNEAALAPDATKLDNLRCVKEVVIKKDPTLLDNFLDEVLGFQNDRNAEVRSFLVGFIDEAHKLDTNILPRVVTSLSMLLQDYSTQVQKKVIQVASPIYKRTLVWLAKGRTVSSEVETAWHVIGGIKAQIVNMIDSENDGIRTHAVKFLETVVLTQTYPQPDSLRSDDDFSLEDIPLTLKIARRRKLEEEANMVFDLLVKFLNSPHISSINLMTAVGSLLAIAKARSQFMGKVLGTIDVLRTNLPPTLSASQISSTTKHIKNKLLLMLKQLSSTDYHTELGTLLTNLGATTHELNKSYPRLEELRRRQKRIAESSAAIAVSYAKRARMEMEDDDSEDDDDDDDDDFVTMNLSSKEQAVAVNITDTFIQERLSAELAAQLVIQTMLKLPDTMPPHFSTMYTPIAAAGTQSQISLVSNLLATQLTAAGLGPGVSQAKTLLVPAPSNQTFPSTPIEIDEEEVKSTPDVCLSELKIKEEPEEELTTMSTKSVKVRVKTVKLSEITKPLEKEMACKMMCSAMTRILQAERHAKLGGVASIRNKIITTLAATFTPKVREIVLTYVLEDIKSHVDLALAWLYEEYSYLQGFNRIPVFLKQDHGLEFNYNELLCCLAKILIEMPESKDRDMLLVRLYLESPLITEDATELLKAMCGDEGRAVVGLPLLQELVVRRPPRQLTFLNALLVHTAHENNQIRGRAIGCVVILYDRGDLRSIVEEYSVLYLGFLRLPHPPDVLFGAERGRPGKVDAWNEDLVKACLYLYLALLPLNQKLIQELARVYCQTSADVKRTVLRLLEQPVRAMGMDSPDLLTLVEECPKGAEPLVTRALHILTEKTPPSADLVARVRELYRTRVSDVRFLIPVLVGLTKKEIIAALPKLIKLNPVVVKEVFNRLLGTHSVDTTNHTTPITPAELLIALHSIDTAKCELKLVMKATSLCFNEKQAYTQEVLAVVMQNLMEVNPLPTLLMRTVIQSLSLYPRLIGFVMNILQRLILKQVWKQKKVWEGFIKCCERTQPQSFQVLLQLPPPQLADVLATSPGLQQPLLAHVMAFTENQRAHISPSMMEVLVGSRLSIDGYDKNDTMSPMDLMMDIKEEPGLRLEPAPPGMD